MVICNLKFNINHKIILLPLSVILPLMNFFGIFFNDFYVIYSSFISLLILTWNFPYISKYSYTKPLYFEDLYSEPVNYKKKIIKNIQKSKKFSDKFLIFQQLILSVTISFVVDYIVIKYKMNNYQPMEFLGLIGGILSLHLKISRYIGKLLLNLLYKMKNEEKNKLLQKLNIKKNTAEIEL